MKTPEIREAPVPVRGWHDEGYCLSEWMKHIDQSGWSTYYKDAIREVRWSSKQTPIRGVAFLMSDGSKVIVRAKQDRAS